MERAISSAHRRNNLEGGSGSGSGGSGGGYVAGVGGGGTRARSQPRSWSSRARSESRDRRGGSPSPSPTVGGGGGGDRRAPSRDGRSEVEFRRMIKEFRDGGCVLDRPGSASSMSSMLSGGGQASPLPRPGSTSHPRGPQGPAAPSRLSVYVRKRPLSGDEYRLRMFDVVTTTGDTGVVVHEPKVRVDMGKALVNHAFQFDGVFDEASTNEAVYKVRGAGTALGACWLGCCGGVCAQGVCVGGGVGWGGWLG
jgi:hypothetical protein